MTIYQALVAFAAAAALLTITPGPDTALLFRNAAAGGRRSAIAAALGIASGCLVWGALASIGLGELLVESPRALGLVRSAGAAYLAWVGVGLIARPRKPVAAPGLTEPDRLYGAAPFRQGLSTNLLNPKVGIFYVTFLPQFVPAGFDGPAFPLLLAGIHVAFGLAWSAILVLATVPLGRSLRKPRTLAWLDRVTGAVFVLLGLRLAISRS